MVSDLNTSANNINNSFAMSQRREDETNNDVKKIDLSLKKHVRPSVENDKNGVEVGVKNSKSHN